jgi:hypothetical protein
MCGRGELLMSGGGRVEGEFWVDQFKQMEEFVD